MNSTGLSEGGNPFTPLSQEHHDQSGNQQVFLVPVSQIEPDPGQPRVEFDPAKLSALAESIRSEGVHQPLHVYQVGDRYHIKDGERRWRAAQLAGRDEVPVVVQPPGTWLETRLHQFLTNALQEPLTPLEDAQTLYLPWLGYQVEALEQEQGEDGTTTARALAGVITPTEQAAVLSARLCALAEVEHVAEYAGGGCVRVPWQRVLESCGRGDWASDRRKRHLALLRVEPEVQEALAGLEVSGRTLRALAEHPAEIQQQLVETALAEARNPSGLGAALRAALERERTRQDKVAFRLRDAVAHPEEEQEWPDESLPAVSECRPAEEIGDEDEWEDETEAVHHWPPEAVARLVVGLNDLLALLDESGAAVLDEGAHSHVLPLWAELTERLALIGVELLGNVAETTLF